MPRKESNQQDSGVGHVAPVSLRNNKRPDLESSHRKQYGSEQDIQNRHTVDKAICKDSSTQVIDFGQQMALSGTSKETKEGDQQSQDCIEKKLVDQQKQAIHPASQRTMPSAKFFMIEEKLEAKIKKGDRKNLSKSNFQYDVSGNAIFGEKLLKAQAAHCLNSLEVKGLIVDGQKYYKVKRHIFSEEDITLITTQLNKAVKGKLSKVVFNETKEILKSNCWIEEEDAIDRIINMRSETIKQQRLNYLKALTPTTSSEVAPVEYSYDPSQGLKNLDQEIEDQSSNSVKAVINIEMKMETQTKEIQEKAPLTEMPQDKETEAKTSTQTTEKVENGSLLLSLQLALDQVNKQLEQMRVTQEATNAEIKLLRQENQELREENKKLKNPEEVKSSEIEQGDLPISEQALEKEEVSAKEPSKQRKIKRSKSDLGAKLVSKFTDDGIDKKITLSENPSKSEAMQVLKNQITLTPQEQKRVINQGKRILPKSVAQKDKEFSKALSENLKESDQTIRPMKEKSPIQRASTLITFTPPQRESARRNKDCPPGILPIRWNYLRSQKLSEEALNKAIRKEYYRVLQNELYTLRSRWLVVSKNKQNPFLCSPKDIWKQIGGNDSHLKVNQAIKKWRKAVVSFEPTGVSIPKDWNTNVKI